MYMNTFNSQKCRNRNRRTERYIDLHYTITLSELSVYVYKYMCVYVCVMYCCQLIPSNSFRLSGAPCLLIFLVAPGWCESMSSKLCNVWDFGTCRELWRSGEWRLLLDAKRMRLLSSTARPREIVWCWPQSPLRSVGLQHRRAQALNAFTEWMNEWMNEFICLTK